MTNFSVWPWSKKKKDKWLYDEEGEINYYVLLTKKKANDELNTDLTENLLYKTKTAIL